MTKKNVDGDIVCVLGLRASKSYDFTAMGRCKNDDAESARIINARPDDRVLLFDRSDFSESDDWVEIAVRNYIGSYVVADLERSSVSRELHVNSAFRDNLNGKVSSAIVLDGGQPSLSDINSVFIPAFMMSTH